MTALQMLTIQLYLVFQEGISNLFNIKTPTILSIFLSQTSTHKIVAISTVARPDHVIAQTRELACTKKVLPNVIAKGKMKLP